MPSTFAPYTHPPDRQPSYQSGTLPSSSVASLDTAGLAMERGRHNEWETTYGLRVDVLAAFAYILGPISAFTLLVLETHNDYVRFHAYQSALLTIPLILAQILAAILQSPPWIRYFLALLLSVSGLSMATQAFLGASRGGLARYRLPKLGSLADQWVEDE